MKKKSREVVYKKISEILREKINNKSYKENEKLPSENALAIKFKVSRLTIRRALDILLEENLIEKKKGYGSFVKSSFNEELNPLKGFTKSINKFKISNKTIVIKFRLIKAPDYIARSLNLRKDEKVHYCERIRYINNIPEILEKSYIPYKLFPNMKRKDLKGSKYKYVVEETGEEISKNIRKIYPWEIKDKNAMYLGLKEKDLILKIVDINFLKDDLAFEYCISFFNSKKFEYLNINKEKKF